MNPNVAWVKIDFRSGETSKITGLSRVPCVGERVKLGERIFAVELVEYDEGGENDARIEVADLKPQEPT